MKVRGISFIVVLAAASTLLTTAHALDGCAPGAPGGEWPMFGNTSTGTRSQPAEEAIGPDTVGALSVTWMFSVEDLSSDLGLFQNTPIVADGCVYGASTNGWVVALNADDGSRVWATRMEYDGNGIGGAIIGSPVVSGGRVYVFVSQRSAPYLAALDQQTGDVLWSTTVDDRQGSFTNASPVLWNGLILAGFSGDEGAAGSRGGFAIIDSSTGERLAHTYVIPDAEFDTGHEGASIWTTPVIDPATGYAYAGTGNPTGRKESRYANAIVKIDMNRASATFGTIVDAYKGNLDSYLPGFATNGHCEDVQSYLNECRYDLDFGAGLSLFSDSTGRTIVGAIQKSGIYHAVFADTLQQAWTAFVAPPCLECNAATPAVDDDGIYVDGTPPGHVVSLSHDNGVQQWVAPVADGIHYHPVTVANGIAYTISTHGLLLGYSTADGTPVMVRSMSSDMGRVQAIGPQDTDIVTIVTLGVSSSGISVARNSLFVAFQGHLLRYSL